MKYGKESRGASGPHNTKQAATPTRKGQGPIKVAKPRAPKGSLKGKRNR